LIFFFLDGGEDKEEIDRERVRKEEEEEVEEDDFDVNFKILKF
jgi:hypothetical protein